MKRAKQLVSLFLLVAALGILIFAATSTSAQTPPKPTTPTAPTTPAPPTGVRIGTIIKDAISTAFPSVAGIGGLIDAIWKNKKAEDKMNKSQTTQAANDSQDNIKQNAIAQAQQNLTPLAEGGRRIASC
jgi:hypothetical protein